MAWPTEELFPVAPRDGVRVSDFRFELPEQLIATVPVEPRDAARLLVHDRAADRTSHRHVRDLGELLRAGDLLVLNDTRVLPYRLIGRRESGGRVEVLILERDADIARGYVRPARKIRPGQAIVMEGGRIEVVPLSELGEGVLRFRLRVPGAAAEMRGEELERALEAALEEVGRAPLPPYISRPDDADPRLDRERYQTVFARQPGAVAAPTAGLHFTTELLDDLRARGVRIAQVTLHVGEGTFAPVRVKRLEDHVMHEERYELSDVTAAAVAGTRARRGRVVAVGTTAARTLETCARPDRTVRAGRGTTRLFAYPGYTFRVVDALLTNFHLPESTLLMLVSAFAGLERTLRLYREAVDERYRFYSYGDAMLLL